MRRKAWTRLAAHGQACPLRGRQGQALRALRGLDGMTAGAGLHPLAAKGNASCIASPDRRNSRLRDSTSNPRRAVFVTDLQTRAASRETALNYDRTVSGPFLYNYFRDYDPSTGRFPQADPIGLAGGSMSLYTYADNAPTMKTDPLGLATYMCTQPLHALGDKWGSRLYPESRWNPSPFYHQYACVSDGKGGFKCGGQDRQGGPWSPGKPSDDQYKPDQCKQEEPDNTCIEQCLLKKFAGPRPGYGLFGPGTNCQEWAEDAVSDCRKQCKKK